METLGKFGLDPFMFLAQLVNFLIIAWVIFRFLLKPLMATMKKRSQTIAQGLRDADEARNALRDAESERQKILQKASAEAYKLLETARDEAERVRVAALERAGKDADRLIADARAAMELERRDMERAIPPDTGAFRQDPGDRGARAVQRNGKGDRHGAGSRAR